MKLLIKIILPAMLLIPVYSHAQFTSNSKIPSGTTLKSGVNLSSKPKLSISKTTLDQLNSKVLDKSFSSLPKISMDPADLERNRVKSWEITPSRPIISGMDISLTGNYSKTSFYIKPILMDRFQGQRFYQAVNLSLITSMLTGKDYRLTIELENPNEIPDGAEISLILGDTNYLLKPEKGKKEIYFLFNNTLNAPQIISIGPVISNEDYENPKGYGITKLKLEELAPAQ